MKQHLKQLLNHQNKRVSFFAQNMLAYLLIVTVMGSGLLIITQRSRSITTQNYLQERQFALDSSLSNLSMQITNYRSVNTALANLEQYTQAKLMTTESRDNRYHFVLGKLRKQFSYICDELVQSRNCFLYFKNSHVLIMHDLFSFDGEEYLSNLFSSTNTESILNQLNNLNYGQLILPVNVADDGASSNLLYLYRPSASHTLFGMIISPGMIYNLFKLSELPEDTVLQILSTSGELLYETQPHQVNSTYTLTSQLDSLQLIVRIDIPSSYFRALTAPVEKLLTLYVIVTLAFSLIISLAFAMQSSASIRKLLNHLHSDTSKQDMGIRNEILILDHGLRRTNAENQFLKDELSTNRELLRLNILSRLLVLEHYTRADQMQIAEHFSAYAGGARVLCIQIINDEACELGDSEIHLLTNAIHEYMPLDCLTVRMRNDLFALLMHGTSDFQTDISDRLNCIQTQLNDQNCYLCAGASAVVPMSELHTGYLHAQYAMQPFAGELVVFTPNEEPAVMHYADLSAFRSAVMDCDKDAALVLADHFGQLYSQHRWIKGAAHFILDSIATEMKLENVAYIDNEKLIQRTERMIAALVSQKGRYVSALTEMILQYLKDHYDDPSLSVDSLVNQFKISKTYLYQIFRNSFSSTPGDILEQIRMDHAQNLLLNTEMNIADIADTCGYNSSNTFLKAYKKRFNCTPTFTRSQIGETD